jgi:hypothetical protein
MNLQDACPRWWEAVERRLWHHPQVMRDWSAAAYLRLGALYLVLALPGVVALVSGRLLASRDPNLLLSLFAPLPGALFLLFGGGRLRRNGRSAVAVRLGSLAVFFAAVLGLSWLGVRAGVEPLMTSVRFCAMAASYLTFLALGFLVAAAVQRGATSETS